MIFYFSGTGNSAWVARQIAKAQQEELLAIAEEINKNKEYALKDGEKVGFVFPVYAWGPPGIVLRFIRQLKMKNPEYLFLFAPVEMIRGVLPRFFICYSEKRMALRGRLLCYDAQYLCFLTGI